MCETIGTICGYVAIVGRPNVGKSTLLNCILGHKVSITSRKPQTTRHRLLGVKTLESLQVIYVDTPGMHIQESHALNRYMNQEARRALEEVDAIIFVVDGFKWTEEDQLVFDRLGSLKCPIILAINKDDLILDKTRLLPYLETLGQKFDFFGIVPISAKYNKNIAVLEKMVSHCLPNNPHYFPNTDITDRPLHFRIAEIIREKIIRTLGDELPYTTTVQIEDYTPGAIGAVAFISAIIWVAQDRHKPIVIGRNGVRLKAIGTRARQNIQTLLKTQVHLKLWVKVRDNWSDDERSLKYFGYVDF